MGAWIEILPLFGYCRYQLLVAPLVGAWIEMFSVGDKVKVRGVAPLVGAWIEILKKHSRLRLKKSLLSWERGLKYLELNSKTTIGKVAPLVGAWIEISTGWRVG